MASRGYDAGAGVNHPNNDPPDAKPLMELHAVASMLDEYLGQLTKRLEPLLVPEVPTPTAAGMGTNGTVARQNSPTRQSIEDATRRLRVTAQDVLLLAGRVDL